MANIKDKKIFFRMFSDCMIVNGHSRSIIVDLQKSSFVPIPANLVRLIELSYSFPLSSIYETLDGESERAAGYFFSYLEKNGFGFFTISPERFPPLRKDWKSPLEITNSIIDIKDNVPDYIYKLITELDDLGCECLQIRAYSTVEIRQIEEVLSFLKDKRMRSIEIISKWKSDMNIDQIKYLVNANSRVHSYVLYGAPKEEFISINNKEIIFTTQEFSSELMCGFISKYYFSINTSAFAESHHHNSCLNRKISVDTEGNIKNCPSMPQSYGNIRNSTLREVLGHPGFKTYWNITKDQIAVCKDCEFRYICTDCRAYLEYPENIYSKPLKCGYNPYTSEWEEWSTHPMKQKAIDAYGMRGILPEFKMKPDYAPNKKTNSG